LLASNSNAQTVPVKSGNAPAMQNYLRLPLAFERQRAGRDERFIARGSGYAIGVQGGKATIGTISREDKTGQAVSLEFAGGR
jgi:hypothetical protein